MKFVFAGRLQAISAPRRRRGTLAAPIPDGTPERLDKAMKELRSHLYLSLAVHLTMPAVEAMRDAWCALDRDGRDVLKPHLAPERDDAARVAREWQDLTPDARLRDFSALAARWGFTPEQRRTVLWAVVGLTDADIRRMDELGAEAMDRKLHSFRSG